MSTARAPFRFFAMPDRVIVVEEEGADEMRDEAWKEIPHGFGWKTRGRILAVAPSGLTVWEAREERNPERSIWVGTVDGDCGPSEIEGLRGRKARGFTMDGRHRVWIATSHGIVVVDRFGKVLADYAPGSLRGIDGTARVLAASAGPATLPAPGVPRRIDVVGHLRASKFGPIVNAKVSLRASDDLVREAVTDSVGTFRLTDVPEGDYDVSARATPATRGCPPRETVTGFELSTSARCPTTARGATCDLGELSQCVRQGP